MKTTLLTTLIASVCLPINVWAQQNSPLADDMHALVPPLSYQSAFKDYLPPAVLTDAPDSVWITVNREVQDTNSEQTMNMPGDAMNPEMKHSEAHEDDSMNSKGK